VKTNAIIFAPDDQGLIPIFGMPTVRRLVRLLHRVGVGQIHVFGRTSPLQPVLADLLPSSAFHPTEDLEKVRDQLVQLGVAEEESVLVLMANTVVDRRALSSFIDEAPSSTPLASAARNAGAGEALWQGRVAELATHLSAASSWQSASPDSVPRPHAPPETGLPCLIESGRGSIANAEQHLLDSLALQSPDDGFFARYFDRRISRPISSKLARTAVTPNQVTLGGVSIGLAGAWLLSQAGYWQHLAGALLFLICIVVDGVDGEVARLKLMESTFGHYLDVTTDNLVHFAVFVGLAFGLYRQTGQLLYLHALGWLLGGFVLCIVAVYYCILRRSPEEMERSPKIVRLLALLSNRDFAYLIFVLAVIDRLGWFLLGAAAGTFIFAAVLWTLTRFESRATVARVP